MAAKFPFGRSCIRQRAQNRGFALSCCAEKVEGREFSHNLGGRQSFASSRLRTFIERATIHSTACSKPPQSALRLDTRQARGKLLFFGGSATTGSQPQCTFRKRPRRPCRLTIMSAIAKPVTIAIRLSRYSLTSMIVRPPGRLADLLSAGQRLGPGRCQSGTVSPDHDSGVRPQPVRAAARAARSDGVNTNSAAVAQASRASRALPVAIKAWPCPICAAPHSGVRSTASR